MASFETGSGYLISFKNRNGEKLFLHLLLHQLDANNGLKNKKVFIPYHTLVPKMEGKNKFYLKAFNLSWWGKAKVSKIRSINITFN